MCCSSAPGSAIDFGFRTQAIEQGEHETKEKDDVAARKAAERRKALAEALRIGQPVMVNPDGTVIVNTDKSADSNAQINVSGLDVACDDSTLEGIVVSSGETYRRHFVTLPCI